ncbi:hypothetical protein QE374_002798 [Microbacterium sp. SORGH_AS428]|uniref:hypothetical protein n=1 Tax=Microbacterium sp. SORGH_AS_0428 TaxID=3041788 RepID=UPI002862136F|nr:hypothetical protein [Microbacterium sp. SORGH_AS_0428]MDR6200889.1 hypothetical protein [Microbacterium sp. SORGH_AS_0428]
MDDARFLAGPKEVGVVLGVEPNTVNVWQRRQESTTPFPSPVVRLAGMAVWDIREVIAWADETGRTVRQRDYSAPGWNAIASIG